MPYTIQLHIMSIWWAYHEQMKQQKIWSVHMRGERERLIDWWFNEQRPLAHFMGSTTESHLVVVWTYSNFNYISSSFHSFSFCSDSSLIHLLWTFLPMQHFRYLWATCHLLCHLSIQSSFIHMSLTDLICTSASYYSYLIKAVFAFTQHALP